MLQEPVGGSGIEAMTFLVQDRRSGDDAWMGCRGRGIVDDLQALPSLLLDSSKLLQVDINLVGYTGRYAESPPSNWPSVCDLEAGPEAVTQD
jgi:hypothetical protein